MVDRLKAYIAEQHLFSMEQRVLLAVSGGRDSVCMATLMREAGFTFAIAHCNFHLRPGDCDRDQRFVRQLADNYGVPFFTVDFDTRTYAKQHGQSIEEAARTLRYQWFATTCAEMGYDCLATAHHRDDSVETLMLNLLRGTGIAGLHGIRPRSSLSVLHPPLVVVHPMLCFSRADIDGFLAARGIDYVEDNTNAQPHVRRNQIRLQVIPLLRRLYPSFDATMTENIERFNDAERLYNAAVESLRERLVQKQRRCLPTTPCRMESIRLDDIPEPRATILFELLRPYGFNAATAGRIAEGTAATGKLFTTATHTAVVNRGSLIVAERCDPVEPVIVEREGRLQHARWSVMVDADLISRPLTLRLWQQGDRFCPFGMTGRRKVSDYLKDMKINRIEKQYIHLLVDAEGRIVWVVGLGLDNRFRVSNTTQHVLRLEVRP